MVVIVGAAVGIIIGCENPQPAEFPVEASQEVLPKAACDGVIALNGKIPFPNVGTNPPAVPQLAQVSGEVKFHIDSSPLVLAQDMVSVSLTVEAILQPLNGTDPIWAFSGRSQDFVPIAAKVPTLVLKTYKALGPGQTVTLYIEYGVGACSVTVERMWALRRVNTPTLPATN